MYFDNRWQGAYGISRYAGEIRSRLGYAVRDLQPKGDPLSPQGIASWEATCAKARLGSARGAFLMSPSFTPSMAWMGRSAITVHDLIHLDVPAESSRIKGQYYERIVKRAVLENPITFTVSEFSKNQICSWTGVSPDRVVVVGNAPSASFTESGPVARYPHPYFLYVGNSKPHKNTRRLIEAFSQLEDTDTCLVLTGAPAAKDEELLHEKGLSSRVFYAGIVSESHLAALYRGSLALVFPSLYEGFGIPAVEAMACGTAVIASNVTSLPEVVGDAGLLVDPHHVDSIHAAMRRIAEDQSLRSGLVERGFRRVQEFTWDAMGVRVNTALQHKGF